MKKNLISVIILALVFANFVLTALLMFTVLPETKKANELITAVCNAVSLELNSGAATGLGDLPIDQVETYSVNAGAEISTNLKRGEDGKNHYVVLTVSLSLNKKSDNYSKYPATVLAEKDEIIRDNIIEIIGKYTMDDFNTNTAAVKAEILSSMQSMFGADYVVSINFSSYKTT